MLIDVADHQTRNMHAHMHARMPHTHTHAHTHARAHTHTPKHLVIRYSWSMSDSPGKRGSPVNISENNEPMAQMSIALMRESTQRLDACDQAVADSEI